jgi:hypothetical protein
MIKRTESMIDDINGNEGASTVSFGIDGTDYEIDLNEDHAAELREVLAKFVAAARVTKKARKPYDKTNSAASAGIDPKAVRAWAAENNVVVSPRGRISIEIINQYRAATA